MRGGNGGRLRKGGAVLKVYCALKYVYACLDTFQTLFSFSFGGFRGFRERRKKKKKSCLYFLYIN